MASGVIVSILCLTGFFLALQIPIDRWANRDLMIRPAGEAHLTAEALVQSTLESEPRRYTGLEIPTSPTASWALKEGRKAHFLDPYTGELLGTKTPVMGDFFQMNFRLHRWLLLDREIGRPITGFATSIFCFVLISGFALWFIKTSKNFARGLRFKRGSSLKRTNYDLHVVLGIYCCLPLLVMAVTGLFWSYRDGFIKTTYRLLDGTPPIASQPRGGGGEDQLNYDLPYSELLAKVDEVWPYEGVLSISFPTQGEDSLTVTKSKIAGFGSFPVRDEMVLRVSDLEIIEHRPFKDKTRAQKFLTQIKGIHMGTFWGDSSLLFYVLMSLLGATFPITGTIIWGNRMWSKRKTARLLAERSRHKA